MNPDDVAKLDGLIEAARQHLNGLYALRSAVVGEPGSGLETCADGDFPTNDLLDTTAAGERFSIPRDRLTRWCRETEGHPDAIGKKVGGRWMVSISRIRALKL